MTAANLARLKALALAATPGPWESTGVVVCAPAAGGMDYLVECCDGSEDHPNLKYIAAANPAAVLDLVERLERADRAIQQFEAMTGMLVPAGQAIDRETFGELVLEVGTPPTDMPNFELPDLRSQLARATAQVRGLVAERDRVIAERNNEVMGIAPPALIVQECDLDPAELTRLLKAHKPGQMVLVAQDTAHAVICPGCFLCFDARRHSLEDEMPDDPLDDILPLKPLPLNLPASLDLPGTEGSTHD